MKIKDLALRIMQRLERQGFIVNDVAWEKIRKEIALELACAALNAGVDCEFDKEGQVL